tara:strand:+ start:201 stop:398 length:198 start_codon:yes stop_codon:yes gene_type:complete
MKKNLGFILFIALAILALYISKINYGDQVLKKSISACILAQTKKDKTMTKEFAKNYCEKEIKKNK